MIEPKIAATFDLDSTGKPTAVIRGTTNHYNIRLHLIAPPDDTYAVTYRLHDSYYEPVRESRDKSTSFSEDLTSYGDYTIKATIRTKRGALSLAIPLSQALQAGHAGAMSSSILSAIEDIKAH